MKKKLVVFVCIIFGVCSVNASIIYNDEAEFIWVTYGDNNLIRESFEDMPVTSGYVSSIECSGFTLASDAICLFDYYVSGGLHATDGVKHVVKYSKSVENLNIYFDSPITSFGMTITDGCNPNTCTLTFANDIGDSGIIYSGSLPNGNTLFFGITSEIPFSHITIGNTYGDAYSIDKVYCNVPEPATIILLGLGGLVLRRKK